ncbi:amine sulfotransferase-like [Amblyomma americanum]
MTKRKPFAQLIDGVPRDPHWNPELSEEALRFRPGKRDLVVTSFPKSGTHWVLYIVELIMRRGQPVSSYEDFTKDMRYLGVFETDSWKSRLPLRLFQTHLPPPKEAASTEGKYIYVARNPWDVAVSLFHMVTNLSVYRFQDGSFDELIDAFLSDDVIGNGNYFDHVVSGYAIKDEPNVLFVTYENLMEDTRGTILKLANFLGDHYARELEEDDQAFRTLLSRCAAERMRDTMIAHLDKNTQPEFQIALDRLKETCKSGHNGDSAKYNLVREARVGGWKKHFTPEQLQRTEAAVKNAEKKSPVMDLWRNIRDDAIAASSAE